MKTLLVSILAISYAITANCQESKYITLQGTIIGLKDSTKLTLIQGKDTSSAINLIALNQKFNLRFKIPGNGVFYTLILKDSSKRKFVPLLLDQSDVLINGSFAQLSDLKVEGSKSHQDLKRFKESTDSLIKKMNQKMDDFGKGLAPNEDAIEIGNLIIKRRLDFITDNPNSAYTPFLIKTTSSLTDSAKLVLYNDLTAYAKKSYFGIELSEMLKNNFKKGDFIRDVRIGAKAPDFSSIDLDGNVSNLYNILKKGKLTLLDFWASWCRPCRAENPNVRKVFDSFHHNGFNVVSVSFDSKETLWKEAIINDGMPWYHFSDLKGRDAIVHTMYGINGIPDNFLLDENGKILARGLRGQDLYKKVEEVMKSISTK